MENKEPIQEQKNEKQTPFMKRVADLEKKFTELETKLNIVISALKR